MACPFFYPEERCEAELWQHRRRLPLGDGFRGLCIAPGHVGTRPADDELRDACNMGCALECQRLPREREADSVAFTVARESDGVLFVRWVKTKDHQPVAHGTLEFDRGTGTWRTQHEDAHMQHMAARFVSVYVGRAAAAAGS